MPRNVVFRLNCKIKMPRNSRIVKKALNVKMPQKFHAVEILCLKVSIAKGLSSEDMFKFFDTVEIQGQSE